MAPGKARKILRFTAWAVAVLLVLACAGITATVGWRPVIGPRHRAVTTRTFERTPARLERGKYLVENVAGCFNCHSKLANKPGPGEAPEFKDVGGGTVLIDEKDFVVAAPNITPDEETGAGAWSDDQFARGIREGIGHDGRALFPIMPYGVYKEISDEDVAAIVVYLRSVPAVHKSQPKPKIPFPLSRIMLSFPEPVEHAVNGPADDPVSRGKYLVAVAHCQECHTPMDDHGKVPPDMDFAGGGDFTAGFGVVSANITPDATGIGYYDEALFVKTMRTGSVGARPLHVPMPWWNFRNMTDDDLKAVFAYLRTVKPVHHAVDNTEVATLCKRCNVKHGLGDHNEAVAKK